MPLPFRPTPVCDELLSSWIGRLAIANHCDAQELCRYLGLKQGRVPVWQSEVGCADLSRLCRAVQLCETDVLEMTLPNLNCREVVSISRNNFQHCRFCTRQMPGLVLRHWRFAWSLVCEVCSRNLVSQVRMKTVPRTLAVQARAGARALRTAVMKHNRTALRSIEFNLSQSSRVGMVGSCPITSSIEHERLRALAIIYSDLKTAESQKRTIKKNSNNHRNLKNLASKRHVPGRGSSLGRFALPETVKGRMVSRAALSAARQAITELGQDATHRVLLQRAAAILNAR